MIVTAGKTNVSVYYYIVQDASATSPGEPVTGLLFSDIETGGSASYARQGAARVDLTLVTLVSASAAHTDGGFILVDDANMPGLYRCDYPDLAFATGVDQVFLQLVVASAKNAVVAPLLIDITNVDLRDGVRGGMTALPNAAADAVGGLPISNAGGLDLDTQLAATNEVTAARMATLTDWIDGGRLDLLLDAIPTTAMRGTDSAALASVCTEGRLAELDAVNLPASVDAIPTTAMRGTDSALLAASISLTAGAVDTVTTLTGHTAQTGDSFARIGAAGAGLVDLGGMSTGMKAEILVEVNAAIDTAIAELPQGVPTATPNLRTLGMLLYMALRNRLDVDTSGTDEFQIHNDAGTVIAKKALTDDGADFSEAEMVSGP